MLRLRELGHQGQILAITRGGAFPARHASYEALNEPTVTGAPPVRARELLRAVHQAIKVGGEWRAVIDSLRERTNELWTSLSLVEQRRFHRHLRRRFDLVRHQMAPPIADQIEAELERADLASLLLL